MRNEESRASGVEYDGPEENRSQGAGGSMPNEANISAKCSGGCEEQRDGGAGRSMYTLREQQGEYDEREFDQKREEVAHGIFVFFFADMAPFLAGRVMETRSREIIDEEEIKVHWHSPPVSPGKRANAIAYSISEYGRGVFSFDWTRHEEKLASELLGKKFTGGDVVCEAH